MFISINIIIFVFLIVLKYLRKFPIVILITIEEIHIIKCIKISIKNNKSDPEKHKCSWNRSNWA